MVVVAETQSKVNGKFQKIPIQLIRSPENPSREVFEDIKLLTATVKKHGLLEPLLVKRLRDSYGFEVMCGLRRLKACQEAKLETVPCLVLDNISEEQALEMQLVENLQRSDLKPFEEIRLVKTLKDHFQLSNAEIGMKIGLSDSSIGDYFLIAEKLPEDIIRMIVRTKGGKAHPKEFSLSKAVLLARSGLPLDQLRELVRSIAKIGYTRKALAQKLARIQHTHKIKRVFAGRKFWNELTQNLKSFAKYWSDYCKLKQWETVSEFHLELKVVLRKDLGETKV